MTFLNGLLALGVSAAVIPFAIHLIFRNRCRTLDWGAMHLLSGVVASNQRRIEIRHWILLALRCSVPVLLAICLARPVLTYLRAGRGDAPRSLVVLIDDSRSMSAVDQTGNSRLAQAKQSVLEMFGDLTRRDEIMVLRTSTYGAPVERTSVTLAASRVNAIQANRGPADFERGLRAALDAANNASHSQRQVIIVSDFQSRDWSDSVLRSIRELGETETVGEVSPTVSFLNVGAGTRRIENVLVESVSIDWPAAIVGEPIELDARVRNASDTKIDGLRIQWTVDGQMAGSDTVSIDPRSTSVVQRELRLGRAGVREIQVSIEHEDGLPADNRRSFAVNVVDRIRVLLVDGHPDPRRLKSETDFLNVALSPFDENGNRESSAIETQVIEADRVESTLANGAFHVVVLANVGPLPDPSRAAIARYVIHGGALVVFDGDHMDPETFNTPWVCDDGTLTMPGRLNEIASVSAHEGEPLAVGRPDLQDTPWTRLSAGGSVFEGFEIFRYRKLGTDVVDSRADEEQETISVAMANGDPFVLIRNFGHGRVIQFAIPCDSDWTSLPQRSVFVPMMQQLVLNLAGSSTSVNLVAGEPVVISTAELLGPATGNEQDRESFALASFSVAPPTGSPENSGGVPNAATISFASTANPGTYRVRATFRDPSDKSLELNTLRVVEVPADESTLRDVDRRRLNAAAELISANVFSSTDRMLRDDRLQRHGREVWTWILMILLVVLVAELWVQQREIRRRSSAGVAS